MSDTNNQLIGNMIKLIVDLPAMDAIPAWLAIGEILARQYKVELTATLAEMYKFQPLPDGSPSPYTDLPEVLTAVQIITEILAEIPSAVEEPAPDNVLKFQQWSKIEDGEN